MESQTPTSQVSAGDSEPPSIPPALFGSGPEKPGDSIGPFRLLSEIGHGGFGVVWLAERREPFVQRVALKIIKPGMDSREVIARFEQERQALAVMDHPSVAKVLDGGITAASMGSRPYFVMEYVKGEPITQFCDRQRLTIRERLELFIPVCEAVQHAHMKGIIHRDIKPSNILASFVDTGAPTSSRSDRDGGRTDGAGTTTVSPGGLMVKVIDFGVAKAISHTLTEKTIFTEQGRLIGTPEYMSPEQAEMGATDVDTRTDVYSLGVVLYELLTGALPFDSKSLRAAGFDEIRRIIREVEPPTPSSRLTSIGDDEARRIAERRQAEREHLARELRRELEWIPLRAMRKDRQRRYAGAGHMADDLRRYLNGLPIEAAPESRGYRVRKMVARNRGVVGAVAAVMLALAAGLGVAVEFARQARQSEWVAKESLRKSERDRKVAAGLADFLNEDVLLAVQPEGAGPETRASDLLIRGAQQASRRFATEPAVELRVRTTIGRGLLALGAFDDARGQLTRALELANSGELASDEEMLSVEVALAECSWRQYEAAGEYDQLKAEISRMTLRWGADDCRVLEAREGWASAMKNTGRLELAENEYQAILRARQANATCGPLQAVKTRKNLALITLKRGDAVYKAPEAANPLWEKSLAELREVRDQLGMLVDTNDPAAFGTRSDIAGVLFRLKRYHEAKAEFASLLPVMRKSLGPSHWRYLETAALSGRTLMDMNELDGAIAALTEASVGYMNARGADNAQTKFVITLLATAHGKAGNAAEKARLEATIAQKPDQGQPAK